MDMELLGLPAEVGTALALIATGVIVPAVTALLKHRGMPAWAKRAIPIGLSVLAAVVIVVLGAGGPLAEQLITWILVAATIVGIAQTVYSLMPGTWRKLEEVSSRATGQDEPERGRDGAITPSPVSEDPEPILGPQSGLESPEGAEPYRQRTLNQPEEGGESGYTPR